MNFLHLALLTASAASITLTGPVAATAGTGQILPAALAASGTRLPSGGMLNTLPHGRYQCALPGDAGGNAFVAVEDERFHISSASRYDSPNGEGTYILRGRALTFTRGPRKGDRFYRIGNNQLRKLDTDGNQTRLLCTRISSS